MSADPRRSVPRTDTLLADPSLAEAGERLGRGLLKDVVQPGVGEQRVGARHASAGIGAHRYAA